jgi:hypothetical protein
MVARIGFLALRRALRRDDRSERANPGPDRFAAAAWCSLQASGRMARRALGWAIVVPGQSRPWPRLFGIVKRIVDAKALPGGAEGNDA